MYGGLCSIAGTLSLTCGGHHSIAGTLSLICGGLCSEVLWCTVFFTLFIVAVPLSKSNSMTSQRMHQPLSCSEVGRLEGKPFNININREHTENGRPVIVGLVGLWILAILWSLSRRRHEFGGKQRAESWCLSWMWCSAIKIAGVIHHLHLSSQLHLSHRHAESSKTK